MFALYPQASAPQAFDLSNYSPELQVKALSLIGTLADSPAGFGVPCSDRATWRAVISVNSSAGRNIINQAVNAAFPAFDDAAYLAFKRTGSRVADVMLAARISYVWQLALAECVQWQGVFLPQLDDALFSVATQRSWDSPAHDTALLQYNGVAYAVMLGSANYAAELAQVLYSLGDQISNATRDTVLGALEVRIFSPMRSAYNGTAATQGMWWMVGPVINNWNAVCLGGVTTAALAVLADKVDRALFIAGDLQRNKFFTTFTPDGYDTEGIGYFSYVVTSAIRGREIMLKHSGGEIDPFNFESVARALTYALEFPLTSLLPPCGICVAANANFGDDGSTFSRPLVQYISNIAQGTSFNITGSVMGGMAGQIMTWWLTGNRTTRLKVPEVVTPGVYALRKYYGGIGVLTARPDANNTGRGLAVTVKLLGNGPSHSHNDVGSYAISLNSAVLTADPGSPGQYDRDSFGPQRYSQPIFSSYGHPVPVVGLEDQVEIDALLRLRGAAVPNVIAANFSNLSDSLVLNLTAAYNVSNLRLLQRNVTYARPPGAYVLIEDSVSFKLPDMFETAMIAPYNLTQPSPSAVCFSRGASSDQVCASITASHPFDISVISLWVVSNPSKRFSRIGIRLSEEVMSAWVRMVVFDPSTPPSANVL